MSRHPSIDQFPPAYREQILRQLGGVPARTPRPAGQGCVESADGGVAGPSSASEAAGRPRPADARGPNKTELDFLRAHLLPLYNQGQRIVYEGLSLRLPGGSRYTPDFAVFDTVEGFAVILYEVKGSYRLPSEGRALTAFREARASFPFFRFEWWRRKSGGYYEQLHIDLTTWYTGPSLGATFGIPLMSKKKMQEKGTKNPPRLYLDYSYRFTNRWGGNHCVGLKLAL